MRFYVYHTNRGIVAGPFKSRKRAQARMDAMIRESAGLALWLEIVVQREGKQ